MTTRWVRSIFLFRYVETPSSRGIKNLVASRVECLQVRESRVPVSKAGKLCQWWNRPLSSCLKEDLLFRPPPNPRDTSDLSTIYDLSPFRPRDSTDTVTGVGGVRQVRTEVKDLLRPLLLCVKGPPDRSTTSGPHLTLHRTGDPSSPPDPDPRLVLTDPFTTLWRHFGTGGRNGGPSRTTHTRRVLDCRGGGAGSTRVHERGPEKHRTTPPLTTYPT